MKRLLTVLNCVSFTVEEPEVQAQHCHDKDTESQP